MRSHQSILLVLVVCLLALSPFCLEAQACPSLYFDACGNTSTWDYATPNWADNPSGPFDQAWSDGSAACFVGTAGTVNVAGTIYSVGSIQFHADGYVLNGGTINLTGATSTIATSGNASMNSVLSGSCNLCKTDAGMLTLGSANTFTGNIYIQSGTLRLDNDLALQNSTIQNGSYGNLSFGTLSAASFGGLSGDYSCNLVLMNDHNEPVALSVGSNNQSTGYYGNLNGSGQLIKIGTGILALTNANDFMGDTVLRSGTLMLNTAYALQNSTLDAQGGALVIQYPSDPLPSVPGAQLGGLKGSGNLNLNVQYLDVGNNNQSTIYSGVLSGSVGLRKSGGGTLTLSGANTFTGTTSIQGGMIRLDNANALQNSTVCGGPGLSFGTLTVATVGGISGENDLTLMNDVGTPVALSVGNNNRSMIYNGYIHGMGSLVKVGTGILTLTHCNEFAGDTVLRGGIIMLGDPSALQNSTLDAQGGALASMYSFARIGGLKGGGNLNVDIDSLEVGGNNQSTVYAGVLSGTTGLCKQGSGTLTLAGANTFTGTTAIASGILRLDNADALQCSTVSGSMDYLSFGLLTSATLGGLSGGSNSTLGLMNENNAPVALSVGGNNQSTIYYGYLAGPGSLIKTGTGMLALSGTNMLFGDTVLRDGTLVVGNRNDLQNSTIDAQGGNLSFSGNDKYPPRIGGLKGGGNLHLDTDVLHVGFNDQSTVYAGILSGTTGLCKQGSGTLTLAGANTFTGTTSIASGGTLRLDNPNALQNSTFCGSPGSLSFGSLTAATFGGLSGDAGSSLALMDDLGEPVALSVGNNNRSTIYSGSFSGPGSLIKVGSGILTLSDASSFGGDTVLRSGTIFLGNPLALQYSTLDAQGGELCLGTTTATLGGLKGSGNLNLDADALCVGAHNQSTTYRGVLSGSIGLRKMGIGVLTLSGANTFTGETFTTDGTLRLDNPYALQNSTFCGGNLSFGTITAATLGGLGGHTIYDLCLKNEDHAPVALSVGNNNQSTEFRGILAGPGSLIKIGTGILALNGGGRGYTGDTVIRDGTLVLADRTTLWDSTVDAQGGTLVIAFPEARLGGLKGSSNVNLYANQLEVGYNNQSTIYTGVLSGSLYFDKVGSGTLTLGGANTFSGTTSVIDGMLCLDNVNALQYSTYYASGNLSFGTLTSATFGGIYGSGSLNLMNELGEPVALSVGNNHQSTWFDGQLWGTSSLVKMGMGMLTLYDIRDFQGDTVLQSGAIALGCSETLQNSTLDAQGGSLVLPPMTSVPTMLGGLKGGGDLTLSGGTLAVGFNGQSTTYDGVLAGPIALYKEGSGRLTLAGANTFTGETRVNGGQLRLDHALALQNSTLVGCNLSFGTLTAVTLGGLTGSSNHLLMNELGEPVALSVGKNNQSTAYDGQLSGPGSLIKVGAGTLTLTNTHDFQGDTVLCSGTIALGSTDALQNSTVDAQGGQLIYGSSAIIGGLKGSGNLEINSRGLEIGYNNQSTTYSGALSGYVALHKTGTGTLTLAGANTYTGITLISNGVLEIANGMALSRSTLYYDNQGGMVNFSNSGTAFLGGLTGHQNLALPTGAGPVGIAMAVGANDQSTAYFGALSGTGTVAKIGSGQWMLGGANEHTGTTIVASGEVRLANPDALQSSTVMLGAMLGFDFGGSMTWHSGGSLSFGELDHATLGGLTGGGHLALTNELGLPVDLCVGNNDSSNTFNGSLGGLGALIKVGEGTLVLNGANSYAERTIVEDGTLEFGPMASWPVLDGAGADVQGGTLTLDYAVGSTSLAATVRDALATGQIICSTAASNGALGWWDIATEGKVSIMYTLSGDANLDHSVNGTDLNAVLSSYNQSDMGWTDGDFNYDGSVNGTDLNAVLSNYNQTLSASTAAVPEPGMLALLLVAGVGLVIFRRRGTQV